MKFMKKVLLVLNVLLPLSLLAWPIALFLSIFMFDAPGSESNWITLLLAYAIWTYPIGILVGSILYWRNRTVSSISILMFYTMVSLAPPSLVFTFSTLLVIICDGQFACH